MEGETVFFRKPAPRRDAERAGEAPQIGVDAALGRTRGQIADPEIGPDETSEVAVAGIGKSHRRRRQSRRLREGPRRHWTTKGRRGGIARGHGRRKRRLGSRSDAETLDADPLAFAIG